MRTPSGEATLLFSFLPPISLGSNLKEKKEQILSFKSRLLLEQFPPQEKHTGSHGSCSPLQKMAEKNIAIFSYTLMLGYNCVSQQCK